MDRSRVPQSAQPLEEGRESAVERRLAARYDHSIEKPRALAEERFDSVPGNGFSAVAEHGIVAVPAVPRASPCEENRGDSPWEIYCGHRLDAGDRNIVNCFQCSSRLIEHGEDDVLAEVHALPVLALLADIELAHRAVIAHDPRPDLAHLSFLVGHCDCSAADYRLYHDSVLHVNKFVHKKA